MRVWVVAFVMFACGVASAQDGAPMPPPTDDQSGITVNLDALPSEPPTAAPKPKAPPVRPLALVRPRPKPDAVAEAVLHAEPAPVETAVALPREKPVIETAAVLVPANPQKPPAAPIVATPSAQPEIPMTIVSSNTKAFPVEISGVARDPFAGAKNVNPLDGFAVLSRVLFVNGKADISAQAQAALDALAQRLLSSQQRIRLAAFSGRAGDLSSDARRLSLARALAIRTYLAAKGVSTERVDVLAYGGATDGITDRVDVLVRGT
jgi:outer membrane protein OmpA-like peptidoglycan-associated protein